MSEWQGIDWLDLWWSVIIVICVKHLDDCPLHDFEGDLIWPGGQALGLGGLGGAVRIWKQAGRNWNRLGAWKMTIKQDETKMKSPLRLMNIRVLSWICYCGTERDRKGTTWHNHVTIKNPSPLKRLKVNAHQCHHPSSFPCRLVQAVTIILIKSDQFWLWFIMYRYMIYIYICIVYAE